MTAAQTGQRSPRARPARRPIAPCSCSRCRSRPRASSRAAPAAPAASRAGPRARSRSARAAAASAARTTAAARPCSAWARSRSWSRRSRSRPGLGLPGASVAQRPGQPLGARARLGERAVEALHLGPLACVGRRRRVQPRQGGGVARPPDRLLERAAGPLGPLLGLGQPLLARVEAVARPLRRGLERGQRIGEAPECGQGAADVAGAARQRRARPLGLGRLDRDRLGRDRRRPQPVVPHPRPPGGGLQRGEPRSRGVRVVRLDVPEAVVDPVAQARRLPPRRLAGRLVAAEVEEPHQDPAALAGVPGEELVEGALGQEHRLRERLEVEPDDLLEPAADRPDPAPVDLRDGRSVLDALQRRLVRAPPHAAGDAVLPAVDPEVEADAHVGGPVRDQVAQLVGVHARDAAVEREGDRIEDAALAGAGGPRDDEEVEVRQVHLLHPLERGEALDRQRERPHAAVASSSRRSNRSSSRVSASAP